MYVAMEEEIGQRLTGSIHTGDNELSWPAACCRLIPRLSPACERLLCDL